jgi:predicted TIM-barrel fold metal-dependent hydrolase
VTRNGAARSEPVVVVSNDTEYNQPVWEPLWSICEELRMPLVTHVGAATNARYSRLEGVALPVRRTRRAS